MKLKLLVAALGFVAASAANATLVQIDATHAQSTVSLADSVTDWGNTGAVGNTNTHQILNLDMFSLAGKVLDEVIVNFTTSVQIGAIGFNVDTSAHTGKMTNTAAGAETFAATYTVHFNGNAVSGAPAAFSSALAAQNSALITGYDLVDTVKTTNVNNLASGGTAYFASGSSHIYSKTDSNQLLDTTTLGDLSGFYGAGTFGLDAYTLSGLSFLGGGNNITTDIGTYAGAGMTVDYFYHDAPPPSIPEPASLALVGLGLVGAMATRRRKSK